MHPSIDILIISFKTSLIYTLKLISIVIPTIFIMNYLINSGILEKISKNILPITKHLNINSLALSSILACLFSPTVGYSILAEGLKSNKISEEEVIATSLANSFPSLLSHTFTFFLPVVIPILGLTGVLFLLIRLGVALIKTVLGMFYLKRLSKNGNIEKDIVVEGYKKKSIKTSLYSTLKFSKRLVLVMYTTMFLVILLSKLGVFQYLNSLIMPVTKTFNLNPNIGLLALTEVINVYGAVVMAGGFLREGILNPKEVLIGLTIGNIITFSSRYVKHSLPLHITLFGPKLGTKIVMINGAITLLLDIFIIGFLILM
ncbi:nucleoside recognition domain-containing protein [Methanofervidicoccus abyssi]|nr:nucleoside recognition domain-containing protein [Methanofervidicoccus abyssi]